MNNIVFGKYIPIKSIIHDLDPRAKIAALFVMIAAVFIPKSWYCYALLGAVILFVVVLSHIRLSMIL
ncbi:MAG: energy-coupling factor transporter transmembrane protein EcfT, partial [Erysipelotrichaceae bacterium]|nr:energy-coupling factor transporter transmembrane protein EcfT [Erysipelotrichaceae bacterium]